MHLEQQYTYFNLIFFYSFLGKLKEHDGLICRFSLVYFFPHQTIITLEAETGFSSTPFQDTKDSHHGFII